MNKPKSQIETDLNILNFLGNSTIKRPDDLVLLKDKILYSLNSRPYNKKTKKQADEIQWRRTASEIISDGYVYSGKACSDLAVVFLAVCKAAGINGRLVKLMSIDNELTHSIAEIKLNNKWYRIDPSSKDSVLFPGILTKNSIWNKKFKVWKKGRDVWDLGLESKKSENKLLRVEKTSDSALGNTVNDDRKKIDYILTNIENNDKLTNLLQVIFKDAIWLKPFLNDSHHGLKHGDQVRSACLKILQKLNPTENEELIKEGSEISKIDSDKYAKAAIEIAALFHDCGRFNEKGEMISEEQKYHHLISAKRAEIFCENTGLNIIRPYIRDAIINHDFQSKTLTPDLEPPKTVIGKIVQSADQLGWFHPDSINRTLDYNKALGFSFFNPDVTLKERLSWKPGIESRDALTVMLSQLFGPVDSRRFGIEFARNKVDKYKLDLEKEILKIAEKHLLKKEVREIIDEYKSRLLKG